MSLPKWLTDIQKRVAKATPGPWELFNGRHLMSHYQEGLILDLESKNDDTKFIIHAREDLPKLVAKLEQAIQVIDYYADPNNHRLENRDFGEKARQFLDEL